MDPRNYESGAAGSPPSAPASPSNGYPTGGDPQTATPATKPGAFWFYKIGESLRNIITTAGLTPDDGDLNLLQKAIVKLVSATNHVVRLEDVSFGPSVSDGDAVYWDNANSRYDRAIADGTDKQKMVGFADVTNSLVEAFGRSSLFTGLTAGARYYLSGSTAGAITSTAPSEKVAVGLSKSATVMFVDIDPDRSVEPVPAGAVISSADIPDGYLECDGSELSRTTYSALFSAIGTTFGSGDGSTTFNIPDLRGEFIRGQDSGRGVDSGRTLGSWQKGTIVNHDNDVGGGTEVFSHGVNSGTPDDVGADPYSSVSSEYPGLQGRYSNLSTVASFSDTSVGVSRPRNVSMYFCIKY